MAEPITLTTEMMVVLAILGFTIFLFVSELVRVDVAGILVMVILGLIGLVPGDRLFSGFSSNAVISIIAIMIIGAGLDRTGVMGRVAAFLLRVGGSTERRIIPLISGTVGIISSFMQNVGAAALFLPVVSRISLRTRIPLSRLLMPMGFCAILGGTVTMVGSSPLILLNDLIATANEALPGGAAPMKPFGLFAVAPVGLALVGAGILYFMLLGRRVLPAIETPAAGPGETARYFEEVYGIRGELFELTVPRASAAAGAAVGALENRPGAPFLVAVADSQGLRVAPHRGERIEPGSRLCVMGDRGQVEAFAAALGLERRPEPETFADALNPTVSGIAEVVIPPNSAVIGKTLAEVQPRRRYGVGALAVFRGDRVVREERRELVLRAGDTLVMHGTWKDLAQLARERRNFVVATDFPREETRPHKVPHALVFFAVAIALVLFTDFRLSVALLVGALGMILTGVIRIDEAYQAVDWKTVFLLASLIPLGMAVETSGTAAWIAQQTVRVVGDWPTWALQAAVAVLATFFTLVMSNIGATVLLVPIAVDIAADTGADPAVFALTVALATSNSFLIPTHQVNALIMGPAGYRVPDFLRAGGIMTVLFLVVMLAVLRFY